MFKYTIIVIILWFHNEERLASVDIHIQVQYKLHLLT